MLSRSTFHKYALGFLALLMLILAACSSALPGPQSTVEPTKPAATPTSAPATPTPSAPVKGISGLQPQEILVQLDYEPGFVLPEFRFPFGRTPFFTLLADGRAIYIDEVQDGKVMQVQLSQEEAAALLQKVREMGFERLESHTDMCGKMADGTESCIADASTTIMRVRLENGSLREIRNYANLSDWPATYDAIYKLLSEYTHPKSIAYVPQAATLFVRIVPPPDMASPADWPLDPAYVKRAQAAPEQFIALVLSAEESAKWQKNVGLTNQSITFQLNGQPVSGFFVPWLPGQDFSKDIAAQFPAQ